MKETSSDIRNAEYLWVVRYTDETRSSILNAARMVALQFNTFFVLFSDPFGKQVAGYYIDYRVYMKEDKERQYMVLYTTDPKTVTQLEEQVKELLPTAKKIRNPRYKQWFTLED